jgi:hypothetical protein
MIVPLRPEIASAFPHTRTIAVLGLPFLGNGRMIRQSQSLNPMEPAKTVSKTRVILTWTMMVGIIVCITAFFFWRAHYATAPVDDQEAPPQAGLFRMIFYLVIGVFALGGGLVAYFIFISTCFLTFDFKHPVWTEIKAKKYVFNIFVVVAVALGAGFLLTALWGSELARLGLPERQANVLPVLGVIILFQVMQLWVLIWSPVERRMIKKRLGTMGVSQEQLKDAALVGISNPASNMVKRFGSIEEDMGALWITPDRLAFRGDTEQFDLLREHIVNIERKADNRSTTVLAGIAHIVLHVRLHDGSIRQMRLHTEGHWTLGQKGKAMDKLAEEINQWYGVATPVA